VGGHGRPELPVERGEAVDHLLRARAPEVAHGVEVVGRGDQARGVAGVGGSRAPGEPACGGAGIHRHDGALGLLARDRPEQVGRGGREVAGTPRRASRAAQLLRRAPVVGSE
jgi:hypothetical protein